MTQAIVDFFRNLFDNDYLTTFFIALLPIVELRGAVPVAVQMGMNWYAAFGLAYIGSSIVAPILLLLLKPVLNLLKRIKFFARFANAVEGMFQDKAKVIAERAGKGDTKVREDLIKFIGVFTFVALPIPLTGVWTGTAVAVFLGLGFWKSLVAILLGNLTAGTIVTLLSVFLSEYIDIILGIFFIIVLIVLALFIIKVILRMIKSKRSEKAGVSTILNNSVDTENPDKKNDTDADNGVIYGRNLEGEKEKADAANDKGFDEKSKEKNEEN